MNTGAAVASDECEAVAAPGLMVSIGNHDDGRALLFGWHCQPNDFAVR
jgi:hypothetical protein